MKFREISINDQNSIDSIFSKFPPYCDFSFSNLYNWRPQNKISYISTLNDNLVIKAANLVEYDYEISVLGNNNIKATIDELISEVGPLYLVPEDVINQYPGIYDTYEVTEDINNDDYVFSNEELSTLNGQRYHTKRKEIKKFTTNYESRIVIHEGSIPLEIRNQIEDLYKVWTATRTISSVSSKLEFEALLRLIENSNLYNLVTILAYINDKLEAFTINELVQDSYALCGFGKSNYEVRGSTEFILNATAKHLNSIGYKYLNFEQDLGIPSIRSSKLSWRPHHMLKKYTIKKR